MSAFVCAVDVGTGSARAAVFDRRGTVVGHAEQAILLNRRSAVEAEHASEDIWSAVCAAVREARHRSGIAAAAIAAISFDATCSLVVRDRQGRSLPVAADGGPGWDTIAWLDHRALAEAEECTATGHAVLDYLGGRMSPEMQVPKLLWLKRHAPATWAAAGYFFDLADFLTWKASGSTARSLGTLVAKWTFLGHAGGWQADFFARLGLSDVFARGALPPQAVPPGGDLGPLTAAAAEALGLSPRCRVGAGFIDAYAGAVGVLGGRGAGDPGGDLALIAGTSSCIMALGRRPRRFPGGWGPFLGAALPGLWTTEAGQSASGALLDHIVRWHAAGGEPTAARHQRVLARIAELRQADPDLAPRLNVLPDFHGNRAPFADPRALGVISGLGLETSFDSLCRLYFRTAVAIALGLRRIVDAVRDDGHSAAALHIAGGHTRNSLLMELYPDATGLTVLDAGGEQAVLRGTAAAAATAAGFFPDLGAAASAMGQVARRYPPNPAAAERLARDYRVFKALETQRQELESLA